MLNPILVEIEEAAPLLWKGGTADDIRELINGGEIATVRIRGRDLVVVASVVAYDAKRAEKRAKRKAARQEATNLTGSERA